MAVAVKMWSRIVWWKCADVSEEPAASIIRVDVDPDFGRFSRHIAVVCVSDVFG
jgi:hypothetical protein